MLSGEKEFELFDRGIKAFNQNAYVNAHHAWEVLWKMIGHQPRRAGLKVFLQLTGIYQNIELEKWDAVRYGIQIANQRLEENRASINQLVEVDPIESFIQLYKDKIISLKVFDELKIERKWGRVHKDLGTK